MGPALGLNTHVHSCLCFLSSADTAVFTRLNPAPPDCTRLHPAPPSGSYPLIAVRALEADGAQGHRRLSETPIFQGRRLGDASRWWVHATNCLSTPLLLPGCGLFSVLSQDTDMLTTRRSTQARLHTSHSCPAQQIRATLRMLKALPSMYDTLELLSCHCVTGRHCFNAPFGRHPPPHPPPRRSAPTRQSSLRACTCRLSATRLANLHRAYVRGRSVTEGGHVVSNESERTKDAGTVSPSTLTFSSPFPSPFGRTPWAPGGGTMPK